MKYTSYFLLLIIGFTSCMEAIKDNKTVTTEDPLSDTVANEPQTVILEPRFITENLNVLKPEDLYGFWVGDFEPDSIEKEGIYTGEHTAWNFVNKISISIDSMEGESVIGHSIVAGNVRPFYGTVLHKGGSYLFDVKEPGDNKYDGHFTFQIEENGKAISGRWRAYKTLEISKRKFKLQKRLFQYKPDAELEDVYVDWNKFKKEKYLDDPEEDEVYYETTYFSTTDKIFKLNPSVALLKKKQLEELTKADIFILRNSIYAKHGYSFKKRTLRAYFDSQSWYMPVHTDIKEQLTDIEKENIKALLRYEKNAEAYYDEFGRG